MRFDPGWVPVIADIARQVTQETPGRSPAPDLRLPGNRTPAADCDLDHRHPWAEGGPNSSHNLTPCCRHHHQLKDHGWKLEMIKPGHYQWTSPLGHTYTVGPDPP